MEDQEGTEDSQEGEQEIKVFKLRKPPDIKREHQMKMDDINNLIREKETLHKSLNAKKSRSEKPVQSMGTKDEMLIKLQSLKSEKEERMKRKKVIEAELKRLTQQIQRKTETCTKLQASLKYKDEQRRCHAITQLEKHLSTHQLKLSEEKKLVSEIDALKRSKKTLSEYFSAKQDVDHLRQNQKKLRDERDILLRETPQLRAKENDIKTFLDKQNTENKEEDGGKDEPTIDKDSVKKEIDSLYEQRRELHVLYKQELTSYREEQKRMEKNSMKLNTVEKREEMRVSKIAPEKQRQKTRQAVHPFGEEKSMCACLIHFLESQRSQPLNEIEEVKRTCPVHPEVPRCEFSETEQSQIGSFVKKKSNDDLDGLFAVSSRRLGRKGSKKGRKSKDMGQLKLVLHPHVLEQFIRLNLHPPATFADIEKVIEQLKEKKELYENITIESDYQLSLLPEQSVTTSSKESKIAVDKVQSTNIDSRLEKDATKDNEGPDNDAVFVTETSDVPIRDRDVGDSVESVDAGSREMFESSKIKIPSTGEDSNKSYCEQSQENVFFPKIEPSILKDEKPVNIEKNEDEKFLKEKEEILEDKERNTKNKDILHEEQFIPNKEYNEEIINKTTKSVECYDVITETIEKNFESFGVKETTKEIQVRAT